MNILITGCKGQLGTEIHKIASTDTLHNWHFTDVDTLDIYNAQAVENYFETNKIQVCINCAAYTAVDKAEDEPDLALKINAKAPQILAQTCKNMKLCSFTSPLIMFSMEMEQAPIRKANPLHRNRSMAAPRPKAKD